MNTTTDTANSSTRGTTAPKTRRARLLRGLLVVGIAVAAPFSLANPAAAAPLCEQWRVGPYFRVAQSNGYVVTFQLAQYGGRLSGRAFYTVNRKTVWGAATGGIGDTTFSVQVAWQGGAVGNYYGSPWFVKPSGSGLSANMRGNTFAEAGGASAGWQTNAATGESQPIHCDPQDVVG